MAKFDINKKGYDIEQVDNFINKLTLKYEEKLSEQKDRVFSLKNELTSLQDRLEGYKDKDKQISQALIFAVEKAEQIEGNASKLYDLEIKRLRLLYKQWEDLANELLSVELPSKTKADLKKFNSTVKEVLEQNNRIGGSVIRNDLHKNSDNYIRNLLNKMDYAMNSKSKNLADKKVVSDLALENEKENNRLIDLSGSLDSITVKGKGSMADNYLNSDIEDPTSVFAKTFTKRAPQKENQPFDLDEVLTPKEDLDEIMKAFDFFLKNNED
jgi:cell division initiation protein